MKNKYYSTIHLNDGRTYKQYDIDRMNRIRTFLTETTVNSLHYRINRFNPCWIDSKIELMTNEKEASIFKKWYNSALFTKIVIDYEYNLSGADANSIRIHKDRTFLIDYLLRLKTIYDNIEIYENKNGKAIIYLKDLTDILCLLLFFNQINEYLKYDIQQKIPMKKNDLIQYLIIYFEENASDIGTFRLYEDLENIFIGIELKEYKYIYDRTSIVPNSKTDLYFYEFEFISSNTLSQLYQNLNEDESYELSESINEWTNDPLKYKFNNPFFDSTSNPFVI